MGMPAWAMIAGAPLAVDKLIVDPIQSGYNLFKGIRDDQTAQNDKVQAKSDLAAFAKDPTYQPDYAKYSDPATAAKYGEFIKSQRQFGLEQSAAPTVDALQSFKAEGWSSDPSFTGNEWAQGLVGTMGVKTNQTNPYERKALQDFALDAQKEKTAVNAMTNQGGADRAALLQVYGEKALSPLLTDIQRTNTNDRLDATTQATAAEKQQLLANSSGFQSAIAGLTGQSTSPADLAQFAKNGGFAPMPAVEGDIRQAGAAYNATPDAINKAVDDARGTYKDTFLPNEIIKVGRTTASGQRNLLGDFKKDAVSTAPSFKVTVQNPASTDGNIALLWKQVKGGRRKLDSISARGGLRDMVAAYGETNDPGTDIAKLGANINYQQTPQNLQSRALLGGVTPLLDSVLAEGKKLNNGSVKGVNMARNYTKEQLGDPQIVSFNNLRDDVIMETERILQGGGAMSDHRVLRAWNNLNSAQSYGQMAAAVGQIKRTLAAREHALDAAPFPGGQKRAEAQQAKTPVAPSGTQARLANGKVVTSDGKGGWQ
jgi:hypothetical protein